MHIYSKDGWPYIGTNKRDMAMSFRIFSKIIILLSVGNAVAKVEIYVKVPLMVELGVQ